MGGGSSLKTIKDETGNRFGKLLVLKFSHKENQRTYWICRCDCGNEKIVSKSRLINLKSCGCLVYRSCKENSWASLYNNYKLSAKKRNHKFEISLEVFRIQCNLNCIYCGIEPNKIYLSNGSKNKNAEIVYNRN